MSPVHRELEAVQPESQIHGRTQPPVDQRRVQSLKVSSRRFSCQPFRDDLAAAVKRAEGLARDNAALHARLAARRLDWFQWSLVGVIGLCVAAIAYILMAGHN
jgi:hypothetical protein